MADLPPIFSYANQMSSAAICLRNAGHHLIHKISSTKDSYVSFQVRFRTRYGSGFSPAQRSIITCV